MPHPDTQWSEGVEDQIFRVNAQMDRMEVDIHRLAGQLAALQDDLRDNSATTAEIRDLLDAARGAFRFLNGVGVVVRWVGGIAGAGLAIWGAVYAITHGGRPPGG